MNYHDEFDKPILKARVASHKTTFFGRDFKFLVLYEELYMILHVGCTLTQAILCGFSNVT